MVITCQYDPLRDEGDAYARTLAAAGVPVQPVQARGHVLTSLTMVDVPPSNKGFRARMADGLRSFCT